MSIIKSMKRKWRETFGSRKWGYEFYKEGFDKLGTYNAEKCRGIIHTTEWKKTMRELQDRYKHSERQEDGTYIDTRTRNVLLTQQESE